MLVGQKCANAGRVEVVDGTLETDLKSLNKRCELEGLSLMTEMRCPYWPNCVQTIHIYYIILEA